jgi:hypothetical protein
MRVFAGKHVPRCSNAATVGCIILSRRILAIFGHKSLDRIRCLQRVLVMQSAKTIATLASAAAIVCSIFAFSWVGLALLGF